MGTLGQDNPRAAWRIEMLGGLRAVGSGHVIGRFVTQKTAALLARLALAPGKRPSREELVDALWPEADPHAGRDRLSQALVWLRPRLEPEGMDRGSVLIADRFTVGLNPETVTTDVAAFEAALEQSRLTDAPAEQEAGFVRAIALYQGELLPGVYDDWASAPRQRLLDAFLGALRTLGRLRERAGDQAGAAGYARRVLAADALHEEAHADLIRLLAAQGQTTAAHRQFRDLTRLLAQEFGTEPSAETQALMDKIRRRKAEPERPRPPVWPTPLTRFFGREGEIERLHQMVRVDGTRLVTLTGTGGAGKTRLALAAGLKEAYNGAAAFVPLADLDDARMVPAAIVDALRLPRTAESPPLEQIVGALADHPALLVLDNLEHLHPDAAPLIREMLERLPTLTVLATSRQRLGLEGERELSVTSLPLPEPTATPEQIHATASARLFIDRARSVRPDFRLTPTNAEAVARVCARLEGIPLAIELCAAWAQTLTPAQMLTQLTRRFDLLVSRRTDIAPRHRTMRAALEYSYRLLPVALQRLFTRLSVFRGGWTLEAAERVCTLGGPEALSLLADLTELRERSLIVADEVGESEGEPEMRYHISETLREFAWELLPPAERAARRRTHLAFFLQQAKEGPTEQERWTARLGREQENLRAALAWSLEDRQTALGLRLGTALTRYWSIRGPLQEGYDWLKRLLDQTAEPGAAREDDRVLADAWSALGQLAWAHGDYTAARAGHEQALTLRRASGDAVAESLYHLGITAYRHDDYAAAQQYLQESLRLAQQQSDAAGIARVLLNLGNIAYEQQDYAQARGFFQESLALEEKLGNRQRVANAFNNLGLTALAASDYPQATGLFRQALTLYREQADHYGAAMTLVNFGAVRRLQGQWEDAHALLTEGLTLAHAVGNRHAMAFYLQEFGLLSAAEGDSQRSVPLLAASQRLFFSLGSLPGNSSTDVYRQALAAARTALDPATFDSLWLQGLSTPPEQLALQILEK